MNLYRKHRPSNFTEIAAQKHIVETLSNAIKNHQIAHSYLFCGPRGTGKTSTARIIAKSLNCGNLIDGVNPCNECDMCLNINQDAVTDIIEIDAASNRGIDEVRQLKQNILFPPNYAKTKVYIIDEVHMLTNEAFNALLKTLEEPPDYAYFILATTEFHKVPATIISRCEIYNFSELSITELSEHLIKICELEGFKYEKEAIEIVAKMANGGVRDSLSLLQRLSNLPLINVESTEHALGINYLKDSKACAEAIINKDQKTCFEICAKQKQLGSDAKAFATAVLDKLNEELSKAIINDKNEEAKNIGNIISKYFEIESNLAHANYYFIALPILSNFGEIRIITKNEAQQVKPLKKTVISEQKFEPSHPPKELDFGTVNTSEFKKVESQKDTKEKTIAKKTKSAINVDLSNIPKSFQRIQRTIKNAKLKRLLDQTSITVSNDKLYFEVESEFFLNQLKTTENKTQIQKILNEHGLNFDFAFKLVKDEMVLDAKKFIEKDEADNVADFFGGEILAE